jgi:hypothetical protein
VLELGRRGFTDPRGGRCDPPNCIPFKAAAIICPEGDSRAGINPETRYQFFRRENDFKSGARNTYTALKNNPNACFLVYPGYSHNCWTATYANASLYNWFDNRDKRPNWGFACDFYMCPENAEQPVEVRAASQGKRSVPLRFAAPMQTSSEGCPVAVDVFEGNTADPMTLGSQIKKMRERFGLRRLVIVRDRGDDHPSADRSRVALGRRARLDWTAAFEPNRRIAPRRGDRSSLFDEKNLAKINSPNFPNEHLIACRNAFLAQYRGTKREALLRATEVELQKIALATKREKRRLRGKAKIALRVGRIIEDFKMAKQFVLQIEGDAFGWKRNETRGPKKPPNQEALMGSHSRSA